jgi:hypothetical protein
MKQNNFPYRFGSELLIYEIKICSAEYESYSIDVFMSAAEGVGFANRLKLYQMTGFYNEKERV